MKKEKYIVFGSGGFAKEVISYIEDDGHEILAVVSSEKFNSQSYSKYKILSSLDTGMFQEAKFILAVGDINIKKMLVEKNEDRWANFIHSSAFVSKNSKIGTGTIVCPFSSVLGDSIIGNFVTLNVYSCVAHDNIIGDFVTYSPYCGTMGNCEVSDECFFGTASYCLPKIKLGKKIKISSGSIVRHSFLEECTLRGNPAVKK